MDLSFVIGCAKGDFLRSGSDSYWFRFATFKWPLAVQFLFDLLHDVAGNVEDLAESGLRGVAALRGWEDDLVLKTKRHLVILSNIKFKTKI